MRMLNKDQALCKEECLKSKLHIVYKFNEKQKSKCWGKQKEDKNKRNIGHDEQQVHTSL